LIGPSQREKKKLSKLPLSPTIKVIIYGEIYSKALWPSNKGKTLVQIPNESQIIFKLFPSSIKHPWSFDT
jgi:hypothetical protein